MAIKFFDPLARKREKQDARDADVAAVRSGAATPQQVSERNDFFASIDSSKLRITAIGPTAVSDAKVAPAGAKRAPYLSGATAEALRPWLAAGISRRTWFRRREKKPAG